MNNLALIALSTLTLGISACTPTPNSLSGNSESDTQNSPGSTTSTSSANGFTSPSATGLRKREFNESREYKYTYELNAYVITQRKTYTYSQSDAPKNHHESEFKKEANEMHKLLKEFILATAGLVEQYASDAYINKGDRSYFFANSKDPAQTGNSIVSILKDVFGNQFGLKDQKPDFTKLSESICNYTESQWESFFTELRTGLNQHQNALKAQKKNAENRTEKRELREDRKFIDRLFKHEIWEVVKKAKNEESIEYEVLQYLKRQQCANKATSTPTTTISTQPTSEQQISAEIPPEFQNGENGTEFNGVRYYSNEQLQQLPQADTNAENVGTVDPTFVMPDLNEPRPEYQPQ